MARFALIILGMCSFLVGKEAVGADWLTARSFYTHDSSGERVQQYSPIGPFYIQNQGNYQRSGYRNTRSSLQFGGSSDQYHLVEEFGRPVQPYEEWRFPYRPYGAPYEAWGPPYGGLNLGAGGWGGNWGRGNWGGGNWNAGNWVGPPWAVNPPAAGQNPFGNQNLQIPYQGYTPWFDDRYPAFDDRAQWRREPHPTLP